MRAYLLGCVLATTLLGLAACATPGPREVIVPCVPKPVEEPNPFPADILPVEAGIYETMQALLADREVRKGYEAELKASIAACQ